MWIIVENDTIDNYVNILMDDEGNTMQFVDKISAWRYMEIMCKDFGLNMEQFESGVELWRLH